MTTRAFPAPAKLNLFLHVLGHRADGYHELQTLFQLIDLADRIEIATRADGRVRRTHGAGEVAPGDDLVVRAAELLKTHTGATRGADLAVRKRIPLGAGLGGGSSDAATTLVALNHLWDLGLDLDTLAELGAALGADVPLFVRGHTAWAEGIGERLTPVVLAPAWYAVVFPGCAVSTARVFADPALTRDTPPMTIRDFVRAGGAPPPSPAQVLEQGRNDCEPVARALYPEVDAALAWLGARAAARMTGTGAAVFAAFAAEAEAKAALAGLPPEWQGFVARGLARSPLLDAVAG